MLSSIDTEKLREFFREFPFSAIRFQRYMWQVVTRLLYCRFIVPILLLLLPLNDGVVLDVLAILGRWWRVLRIRNEWILIGNPVVSPIGDLDVSVRIH